VAADQEIALIIGAGTGLSASIARLFARSGMRVALASRSEDKIAPLVKEIGGRSYRCDVADPAQVVQLFADVDRDLGTPDVVVFNPNFQVHGPITELRSVDVIKALGIVTVGGFLVAQEAARRMQPRGKGTLLFTGNPSSIRGRPRQSLVAITKGGLRGLAESLAGELQSSNIHVATVIADASIDRHDPDDLRRKGPDSLLDPDRIADAFLYLHRQDRSCWATTLELRPRAGIV
jgi:NAD(P)-dependent dehydrogenase (short-subunit alcohol dehydrogenase family)